jgi:hypothetical protein
MRPMLEVADVFRRHGAAFLDQHDAHLGRVERRVMAAIKPAGRLHSAATWNSAAIAD